MVEYKGTVQRSKGAEGKKLSSLKDDNGMATFLTRTRDNEDPSGKPRVYFTSHPDDFDACFDRLCNDILSTHSCVIYFTENMSEEMDEREREATLGKMNLFVVPVTFKLLCTPSRAMDGDIEFAKSRGIKILPFMMETGLDDFYSTPERFAGRQYLSPISNDKTELGYREKLKKHLDTVLIDNTLAERIRTAFAAYVFLSYRKKDRVYANELIHLIHKIPGCHEIAVWYDEYLVPGEVFTDGIKRAIQNSKIFALLVTPSLLEDPNYVMKNEFPEARDMPMSILPAEMQATDRTRLNDLYRGIPECIDVSNEELFRERLLAMLSEASVAAADGDAERNFLIGLAYLNGIDVEIDRVRAISLITSSAELGLYEAQLKLLELYVDEWGGFWDPTEAVRWGEILLKHSIDKYGEDSDKSFRVMSMLAGAYTALPNNDFEDITNIIKSIKLKERKYGILAEKLGDDNPDAIAALCELVSFEEFLGHPSSRSKKLYEQITAPKCKVNDAIFDSLEHLINCIEQSGDLYSAAKWAKAAYELRCRISGKINSESIKALRTLALIYMRDDSCACAINTQKDAISAAEQLYSESAIAIAHEKTALANIYLHFERYNEAKDVLAECYAALCRVYNEGHPETISTLNELGRVNFYLGEYALTKEQLIKVYPWQLIHLGKYALKTLYTLEKLAQSCLRSNDKASASRHYAELLRLLKDKKENDPIYRKGHDISDYEALLCLEGAARNALAELYEMSGDYSSALEHLELLLPIVRSSYWLNEYPTEKQVEERIKTAREQVK